MSAWRRLRGAALEQWAAQALTSLALPILSFVSPWTARPGPRSSNGPSHRLKNRLKVIERENDVA